MQSILSVQHKRVEKMAEKSAIKSKNWLARKVAKMDLLDMQLLNFIFWSMKHKLFMISMPSASKKSISTPTVRVWVEMQNDLQA